MKKKVDVNRENVLNVVNQEHSIKKNNPLKIFLTKIYDRFSADSYLSTDPIIFPKTLSGNTEYIAFVSSLFAYGRVSLIQKFLKNYFSYYGTTTDKNVKITNKLYYRFQSSEDIFLLTLFLKKIYDDYGNLENCFYSLSPDLEIALKKFLELAKMFGKENNASKGFFFLFPMYGKSALKRIRMFLRWMVRDTDIDFGLWNKYNKADLLYPLDTHILRFSKNIGIIQNTSGTHTNSIKVTNFFKEIDPIDPLKFDFPITRLGIASSCTFETQKNCNNCNLLKSCPFN